MATLATTRSLLVVEDDDDARKSLAEVLRSAGFVVDEAANGREALDLLLAEGAAEPAVLVLDLEMPIMNGWDLIAIVKSYHRLSSIPVVVLSGHDGDEALRHGAIAAVFRKPHDPDALLDKIVELARGVVTPTPA